MTKITSISLFLSLILFITCSPHKKPTNKDNSDKKEPFYRSKDTVINTSIPRNNTKEVLYADFLDKQLSTVCKHFKTTPTDTIFYQKEFHGNYFGGFETWDYPKICFLFGKDSAIHIDIFPPQNDDSFLDSSQKKSAPHFHYQDYAALLKFYCKGISLISNDSVQIAYRKVENPYNDVIDGKHIHDKHIRKYFPTRIPNEVLTLHKIHYEDFIQKPSLLFLEAIEKCYKIDKIKFKRNGSGAIYAMLLYVKNSLFHYIVRAKFANCSPSIQEILGDSLSTAQIPAFVEQHKDMLAEPIVYITIYANQKFRLTYEHYNHEFEHYCLGSKLKHLP